MKYAIPLTKDYKTDSLLVINEQGRIRRIYTPFRVLCINPSGSIVKNTWVDVQKISVNDKYQLLYFIGEQYHLYESFRIYINF